MTHTHTKQESSQAAAQIADLAWTNIALTPLEECDLDLLYKWQNSPSLRDLTMGFRFPIQKDTVKEWLKSVRDQNAKSRVVFAIRDQSDLVGTVSLHSIDQYQRKSLFGIYIGDLEKRSKGTGFISTCLILDYAFNALDLRKVSLEVISTNNQAVKLYERIGFVREGVRRNEYFADGKYIDTYVYGMLRHEFITYIPSKANRLILSF